MLVRDNTASYRHTEANPAQTADHAGALLIHTKDEQMSKAHSSIRPRTEPSSPSYRTSVRNTEPDRGGSRCGRGTKKEITANRLPKTKQM
ncbi:hypothetical protein EVAR_34504_1 [Eumeta japonica]|uniref:Uncharacterized protein n=1 Tax=Eumeta variegata TaxID=151549 RepID=A0A4C1Z5A5_EUMVA|nr:hypothetical protein EVAR_34504_1 [Eumeta japonica]